MYTSYKYDSPMLCDVRICIYILNIILYTYIIIYIYIRYIRIYSAILLHCVKFVCPMQQKWVPCVTHHCGNMMCKVLTFSTDIHCHGLACHGMAPLPCHWHCYTMGTYWPSPSLLPIHSGFEFYVQLLHGPWSPETAQVLQEMPPSS